jgi:hypothetical protein
MTSRADTKVLTVGQICIGERAWLTAKCVVAALPRTLWHLSCLSWKTFFIAPTGPSRSVGLARYLYDERGGTESTHLNAQSRPFRAPEMGSWPPCRTATPPATRRWEPSRSPKSSPHSGGSPRVGRPTLSPPICSWSIQRPLYRKHR